MGYWTRRKALHAAGVGLIGALAGCSALSGQPPAGALVITNDHSEAHTVTVTVTKTSEDNDDLVRYGETPPASPAPMWTREAQFTVDARGRMQQKEFVTETGAFYLEAQLSTGERDTGWVGYYEARYGVAEDTIFVDIDGDGSITIYPSHHD